MIYLKSDIFYIHYYGTLEYHNEYIVIRGGFYMKYINYFKFIVN